MNINFNIHLKYFIVLCKLCTTVQDEPGILFIIHNKPNYAIAI